MGIVVIIITFIAAIYVPSRLAPRVYIALGEPEHGYLTIPLCICLAIMLIGRYISEFV